MRGERRLSTEADADDGDFLSNIQASAAEAEKSGAATERGWGHS